MALIVYRSLGPNYDPLWGSGQQNFLTDIYAVAQAIQTRLNLLQGEWWANLTDGLPLFQSILGPLNAQQATTLITQRILGTPFVTGILSLSTNFVAETLTFTYSATVQTSFGPVSVTNVPSPPSAVLG